MKALKIKFGLFSLLMVFGVSVFLTSCEQDAIIPGTDESVDGVLPRLAQEQLDLSIANWNELFGYSVKAVSYEVIGEAISASKAETLISEITATSNYIPTGDFQNPSTITVKKFEDMADTEITSRIGDLVTERIKPGQTEVKIKWTLNGEPFYSTAIVDETGIVYDNMIFSTVIIDNEEGPAEHANTPPEDAEVPGMERGWEYEGWKRRVWKAKWLWGSTRGKGYTHSGVWCYNGTRYSQYDYLGTSGWFDVGDQETRARYRSHPNNVLYYQYKWGWSAAGSVSYNSSNFSISTSGPGSQKTGSGFQGMSCSGYF